MFCSYVMLVKFFNWREWFLIRSGLVRRSIFMFFVFKFCLFFIGVLELFMGIFLNTYGYFFILGFDFWGDIVVGIFLVVNC